MDKMAPRVDNIAVYLGQFAPVQILDESAGPAPAGLLAVVPLFGFGDDRYWIRVDYGLGSLFGTRPDNTN